ncbi:MinD/ParA family ATP-binding protein [Aeromicrobium alkaliterrae]|uniref:ATPase n=1 Tax=Aeromicrobium alkaliterrae TaxID=302168 RepID=A0ABN2K979_9ACTN
MEPQHQPAIEATVHNSGRADLTIEGATSALQADSVQEARSQILDRVAAYAREVDHAVDAVMRDPEGVWPLRISPDGTVSEGVRPLRAVPAPPAEPVSSTSAELAPLPAPPPLPAPLAEPGRRHAAERRRSFLTDQRAEDPAARGLRGALNRAGLRTQPSAAERAEREDVQAVSQHWPGPRTVAIVNGKGGAGKTPVTVLLSAVFARYGGAGVLAWDNNQTRGTLGWRTEQGPHSGTLLELLPQVDRLLGASAQSADLAHYVHHQTRDRYDVLRSKPMVLAEEQRVEPADVDAIHAVASKYYRLIFIDSGNDESDPMWLRMIDHADQLVVATTTRDDHAEAGALLLEALADRNEQGAQLASRAVAIVSQADPKASKADVARVTSGYRDIARDAIAIPFDPAIVDGHLHYGALREFTQRALLAACAAVAKGFASTTGDNVD